MGLICFFFFKQKTAYEMRISDWSSDVCSSDLTGVKVETHALCDQCGGCNDRPHGGGEHVEMIDVQIRAKLAGAHVGKYEADSNRRHRRGSRCRYIDRRISNLDGLGPFGLRHCGEQREWIGFSNRQDRKHTRLNSMP